MYRTTPVYAEIRSPYLSVGGFLPQHPSQYFKFSTSLAYLGYTTVGGPSVPRYKELLLSGQNATSNRSLLARRCTFANAGYAYSFSAAYTMSGNSRIDGFVANLNVGQGWFYSGDNLPLYADAYDSNVQDVAVAKFRDIAREQIQNFGAGVFAGELRETLNMLLRPGRTLAKKFAKHVRNAKKLRRKGRKRGWNKKRLEKALLNQYLQFTYGISPLLGDIDSAAQALAEFQCKKMPTISYRYKGPVRVVNSRTYQDGMFTCSFTSTASTSCSIKGSVRTSEIARPGSVDRFLQTSGLDGRQVLRDFVPTVYNLFPFSFVADYFSNLNDVLSSNWGWNPELAWSSTSTKVVVTRKLVCVPNGFNHSVSGTVVLVPPWTDQAFPGLFEEEATWLTRSDVLPLVHLNFQTPSFRQLVNVSALVRAMTS